jgi:hypothetical protein
VRTAIAILCLLVPSLALAQTYTTANQFKWDAPTNAMDAADAAGFTYKVYVNGSATGVVLTGVTCGPAVAPDVVFSCAAPLPAVTLAGLNRRKSTVYVTGEDTSTPVSGESDPSNVFATNRKPNPPSKTRIP